MFEIPFARGENAGMIERIPELSKKQTFSFQSVVRGSEKRATTTREHDLGFPGGDSKQRLSKSNLKPECSGFASGLLVVLLEK